MVVCGSVFKHFLAWFAVWFPLNKCRQAELFLPWKCETEHHIYEKCKYKLVMERMIKTQKISEQEANSKSGKKNPIPLIPNTANAS